MSKLSIHQVRATLLKMHATATAGRARDRQIARIAEYEAELWRRAPEIYHTYEADRDAQRAARAASQAPAAASAPAAELERRLPVVMFPSPETMAANRAYAARLRAEDARHDPQPAPKATQPAPDPPAPADPGPDRAAFLSSALQRLLSTYTLGDILDAAWAEEHAMFGQPKPDRQPLRKPKGGKAA